MTSAVPGLAISVGLSLMVSLQPVPASVRIDSGHPEVTTFKGVRRSVTVGSTWELQCDPHSEAADIFQGYSISSPGELESGYYGAPSYGIHAGIKHGEFWVEAARYSLFSEGPVSAAGVIERPGAVFRAVWVSWGGPIDCEVRVNGVRVPPVTYPSEGARALRTTDFEEGAAAALSAGSLGFGVKQEARVTGYIFGLMAASFGELWVVGPHWAESASGRNPWIGVAEEEAGWWRFEAPFALAPSDDPLLWLVLLPE